MMLHYILFKYQALITEVRRTGGGIVNSEIFDSLTRADQVALTYLGIENAAGIQPMYIHLLPFSCR